MDKLCSLDRTEKYRYLRNLEKALAETRDRGGIIDFHRHRLLMEIERTRVELKRSGQSG